MTTQLPNTPLEHPACYAQVVLDIPARALDSAFDYAVPAALAPTAAVGCCVLVDFANRPALGYITGIIPAPSTNIAAEKVKPLREVLSTPYFDEAAAALAKWIAYEYVAPLSETLHLFTPPGSSPRIKKDAGGTWQLAHPGIGPVDDRWATLTEQGRAYEPPHTAVKQRAILDALKIGEMRIAELSLSISAPAASLKALEKRGLIHIESRRRIRGQRPPLPPTTDRATLTTGQEEALKTIRAALAAQTRLSRDCAGAQGSSPLRGKDDSAAGAPTHAILLDGVTGSGKTEVYLQAIRTVLEQGGSACVLVPEISLTPQTVARFRARFGEQVAILHSRLGTGERFDQWDLVRSGIARVVVGARSALFAPLQGLRLIVIDEEHESTYKQSSSPRYVTRDVAARLAQLQGATLVLGSATPSIETLYHCAHGDGAGQGEGEVDKGNVPCPAPCPAPSPRWTRVLLPERVTGKPLPPVQVVNLAAEFKAGNTSMFSRALRDALLQTISRGEKAVLLLNKRGFASFLLCRDCGYVPMCEHCATSLTYHDKPPVLRCHHCGATHPVPTTCPACDSPYLRQLGPGTQYAASQLAALLPAGTPLIRMDADTTKGKAGHEHLLDEFIAAPTGVLLGTQMIAKGLDFPEVTLVGVLIADTSLKFPDFRAPERTYQLLEQVAGRAGRADKDGRVIVQTYWPEHIAIRAAAAHNRELLLADERHTRRELGYPPYARLANILIWGPDLKAVTAHSMALAQQIEDALPSLLSLHEAGRGSRTLHKDESAAASDDSAWHILGPSPCVLAKRQGNHRWHILIKAPAGADIPALLHPVLKARKASKDVSVAVDIDPYDMM
ncbi:MAG: primosomal protein N' [Coriobacteriales bacterium]|jgi:primosomal protein N' (replication factor Y)|nr:primosomal protein N' [Coriobacteriales bacterium]